MNLYISGAHAEQFGLVRSDELRVGKEGKQWLMQVGGVDVWAGLMQDLVKWIVFGAADAALVDVDHGLSMTPHEWLSLVPLGRFTLSQAGLVEKVEPIRPLPLQHRMSPGQAMAFFMSMPSSYDTLLVARHGVSDEDRSMLRKGAVSMFSGEVRGTSPQPPLTVGVQADPHIVRCLTAMGFVNVEGMAVFSNSARACVRKWGGGMLTLMTMREEEIVAGLREGTVDLGLTLMELEDTDDLIVSQMRCGSRDVWMLTSEVTADPKADVRRRFAKEFTRSVEGM